MQRLDLNADESRALLARSGGRLRTALEAGGAFFRDQRVGIRAARGHRMVALREPHRHFRLRVGAFGDRMHLVELQRRLVRDQRLDAVGT